MTSQQTSFAQSVIDDISASPTPFHAVARMQALLDEKGFEQLHEKDAWDLKPSQGYYVVRNLSSLVAFTLPTEADALENGLRLVGAHTDSPCLRVKPQPCVNRFNYRQLGVEVYGGALLHPWFDRDLALAGRVSFVDEQGVVQHRLIDTQKPVANIPSLAIHLNREANKGSTVNQQLHLPAVLGLDVESFDWQNWLRELIKAQNSSLQVGEILEHELSFYDSQAGAIIGLNDSLVSCARLDNLLSCFIGLRGLLESESKQKGQFVLFHDHEEVGSVSRCGADSEFVSNILSRLFGTSEVLSRIKSQSMMLSVDNAHAVHPNYADKHEPNHMPKMNAGPVLKINNNQRYASNSETQARFADACRQANVPWQYFVTRSDLGCGSTIGPMSSAQLGVATVDVGVATLAMHSIRETAGVNDVWYLYQALRQFFSA